MYRTLRSIHLLCGLFALPMLLMYGLSAVQMAHSKWFRTTVTTTESSVQMQPGRTDGRLLARGIMASRNLHGEITSIEPSPSGFAIRIAVPGTVHEIRYDRATGAGRIRTSVASGSFLRRPCRGKVSCCKEEEIGWRSVYTTRLNR